MNTKLAVILTSLTFITSGMLALPLAASANAGQSASITLDPTSGAAGSVVTVHGAGFNSGEVVELWFGPSRSTTPSSGSTYADSNGAFSLPMTVPHSGKGTIAVNARGDSSKLTANASFDITSGSGIQPGNGVLGVSPTDGAPGASVQVSGSAFPENASITIYFGSKVAGTVTSDSQGHFLHTITVPNLPQGLVSVTATSANPNNPPKFYVDAGTGTGGSAALSISPTSGAPGTSVAITGSNFGPDENVNIQFGGQTKTMESDNGGSFTISLEAPSVSSSEDVTITATGQSSGDRATAIFDDVVSAQDQTNITLDPISGAPGDSVAISGTGFGDNENVLVSFGSATIVVNTTGAGDFSTSFTVPDSSGPQTIHVTAIGKRTGDSAVAAFDDTGTTNTQTNITLNPASGAPGDSVAVTGTGFGDNENVLVSFGSATTVVNTTGTGDFSTSFTVPSASGPETIRVTAIGKQTGDSAIASFDEDPGSGGGAPTRAQLEAQIVILQQEVATLTREIENLLGGWQH